MKDHTSLRVWQEAHVVTLGVLRLSRESWRPCAAALFSQLQKASLSAELNIVEGYSFGDTPTYTRHLGIAYGSAVETIELLKIGIEADVLPKDLAENLLSHSRQAQRSLLAILKQRRPFRVNSV